MPPGGPRGNEPPAWPRQTATCGSSLCRRSQSVDRVPKAQTLGMTKALFRRWGTRATGTRAFLRHDRVLLRHLGRTIAGHGPSMKDLVFLVSCSLTGWFDKGKEG